MDTTREALNRIPNGSANGSANGLLANGNLRNHADMAAEPLPCNLRELIADGLRERMQEVRQDVLDRVNDRLDDMVSEILHKVETAKPAKANGLVSTDKYRDKIKSSTGLLPSKQFLERNSILTDLFEIPHFRSLYNVFMSILILLCLHTIAYDLLTTGTIKIASDLIVPVFHNPTATFRIWTCMILSSFCVYPAFCLWARRRKDFPPASLPRKAWDYGWLGVFVLYQIAFAATSTKSLVDAQVGIACRLIILMEQTRLLMKVHAFARSAAPRFLSFKVHSDRPSPKAPTFSQFAYFLFAPTLVYRDSYPRTRKIRWRVVASYAFEFLMTILFIAFLTERLIMPTFENFGREPQDARTLVLNVFATMIPGILFFLCGFYCLLHVWMNGAAELLRFADRLFYKDWWNSTTFGGYYRTWNVVVHDWLHTYIYKDMYEVVLPRNKLVATLAVFSISAIFHEYIIAFGFGFFYPVLLLMFGGFGVSLMFTRTGNVIMWIALISGNGMMFAFYAMEVSARRNCQPYTDGQVLDLFLPRSWLCYESASS